MTKSGLFDNESLELIQPMSTKTLFDSKCIDEMLQKLIAKSQNQTLFDQFKDYRLVDEKTIKSTTGLSQEHFLDLLSCLRSMRDSINRTKSQALAVYLFWLKTGLDQQTIASYFNLENRISTSHKCQQVRDALTEDFVPYNLGPSVMGRDERVK